MVISDHECQERAEQSSDDTIYTDMSLKLTLSNGPSLSVLCMYCRYLLSLCDEAVYNPALYVDVTMFWKYLTKHDFEIKHCVEVSTQSIYYPLCHYPLPTLLNNYAPRTVLYNSCLL